MNYLKFSVYLKNIEHKFKKRKKIKKKQLSNKELERIKISEEELYTFNQLLKFNDILKGIEKE